MGAGFPRIPNRSAFGPTFENRNPVRDPTKDLDAASFNLLAWQVAGASRTVPAARGLFNGASGILGTHYEAWATSGTGSPTATAPGATKTATGNYSFTYPAYATDERGITQAFTPRLAMAFPQGVTGTTGIIVPTTGVTGQRVDVRLRSANGSGVNAPVAFWVW